MALFSSILCALDGSRLAPRVLRHAIALAQVAGAHLTVVTFVTGDAREATAALSSQVRELLPADAALADAVSVRAVKLTMGAPVDAIVEEARSGVDLIVIGTHSKSGLSRWLLGSTSGALLEQAPCPTLLVPPGESDIVALGSHGAYLNPGAVLVAVALEEENSQQLALAAQIAAQASQPLVLMTVAATSVSDDEAVAALQAHAARAGIAADVARTIVGRGAIPSEIDRVAVAEHAGLVVMGLRAPEVGTPGAIATAVLHAKDAIVLAVPARQGAAATSRV